MIVLLFAGTTFKDVPHGSGISLIIMHHLHQTLSISVIYPMTLKKELKYVLSAFMELSFL